MYLYTLGHLHIVHFALLFIQPFIDGVKLIGIVYLTLFCGYLDCTLVDVNQLEPSTFMEKISWINWIWPNNIKVNRDVVFDTVSVSL